MHTRSTITYVRSFVDSLFNLSDAPIYIEFVVSKKFSDKRDRYYETRDSLRRLEITENDLLFDDFCH